MVIKRLRGLIGILAHVGGFCLCILVLLTTANITLRVFHLPIPGAFELSELLQGLFVWGVIVYTTLSKGHVNMEILVSRLSPRARAGFDAFASALGLLVFVFVSWALIKRVIALQHMHETSDVLQIPIYPFNAFMVFAALLVSLEFLAEFAESVAQMRTKRQEEVAK